MQKIDLLPHQMEAISLMRFDGRIIVGIDPGRTITSLHIHKEESKMQKVVIEKDLDFGEAWSKLLANVHNESHTVLVIDREGWNGANQYVRIIVPSAPHPDDSPDAFPTNPYFTMRDNNAQADGTMSMYAALKTTQNKLFPWTPSQGDLHVKDWRISSLTLVADAN